MKKIVLIIIVLLVGCSNKTIICETNINNKKQNYQSLIKYNISSKHNLVTRVLIEESYMSNDNSVIDYFDNYSKLSYLTFQKKYGSIKYKKKIIKKGIKYNVDIDYTNINAQEMINDNYIDKDYIVNDRITLMGLINKYEAMGAKCNR